MVSNTTLTWRIQNIPAHFNEERLKLEVHSDDRKCMEILSLVPDVSNYDGSGTQTATVLFTPPEPREPRFEDYNDFDLDKDFMGFTPLNTPNKDTCADIIVVTGLAGHAFGSWAHSARKMWLRDYLPHDIQNRARVLLYGYESQLHGANAAKSIISDYGNSFTQSLMDLRDHPSGHSLGALIIKQAITDLEPSIRSRLPVRTLIFFGAPHNGLEVTALETLVRGRPTQTLISELKRESPTLTSLADRFRHVAKDMTIHTYYESRPTSTVIKRSDGEWGRHGEALVMVERSSALLNVEAEKTRMKVDGDHKQIARLRRGQGGVYPNVLRVIKNALASASDQFTATRAIQAEIQAEDAPAIESDSGVDVGQDTMEPFFCFDHHHLICDVCYEEFAKVRRHKHCYICGNGNYNVCPTCDANRKSCPGGHKMVSRKLESNEEDQEDDNDEEGVSDYLGFCDLCIKDFASGEISFECAVCNDGDFSICLVCRKAGHICPGGHSLVQSHMSLEEDELSTGAINEDKVPEGTSLHTDTSWRKNEKGKITSSYCDDSLVCRVCRASFDSRNKLFHHLEDTNHVV